jgi:hypothetical protein
LSVLIHLRAALAQEGRKLEKEPTPRLLPPWFGKKGEKKDYIID